MNARAIRAVSIIMARRCAANTPKISPLLVYETIFAARLTGFRGRGDEYEFLHIDITAREINFAPIAVIGSRLSVYDLFSRMLDRRVAPTF